MADIRFQCDACQHPVVAEASASGSEIRCPGCQKPLTVPVPPSPPPDAANAEELPPVSQAGPAPSPPPAAELPEIEGYEVLAKLGEGGMGTVYRARQPMLNRVVALKVMSRRYSDDPSFVARFVREAAAAANLSHRNMVQVFTAGESNGIRFISMEFVEGRTLSEHIKKHGRLDAREAVAVAIYVAQALQYAWNKARLIHRDIKPENVFLSYGGEVKVGDLGLAKSVGESNTVLTTTGVTVGSPHYISPEQARAAKDMDFRADIYSLGCTLFHMLTGRPPFDAEDILSIMMKHVSEAPPMITEIWPECPSSLAALLGRMLAKDRAARPANYEKLVEELVVIHDELRSSSKPSPISPVEPTKSFVAKTIAAPCRKPKVMIGTAVAVVAGVIMFAGLWWWSSWKQPGSAGILPAPSVVSDPQGGQDARALSIAIAPKPSTAVLPTTAMAGGATVRTPVRTTFDNTPLPVTPPNSSLQTNTLVLELGQGVTMELKSIPAGKFMMGSPESDDMKRPNDTPQHEVVLTKPFYMAAAEVTRRQFEVFVSQTGYQTDAEKRGFGTCCFGGEFKPLSGRNWRNPGYEAGSEHPVSCVTWDDANRFCEWLSVKTGRRIRLPTEAEWEYACRAGTTTRYLWGDDPAGGEGWCNVSDQALKGILHLRVPGINSKGACSWNDGFAFTSPVGRFRPNAWGLFDMLGNLWEWCGDWFQRDAYKTAGRVDPQGPGSGSQRVIRGGCFDEHPQYFRIAARGGMNPDWADFGVGFRVCCDDNISANAFAAPSPTATVPTGTEGTPPRYGLYIHFDISTFAGYKGGKAPEFGRASPSRFAPTQLDVRQWARVARQAGMDCAVLTAKHEAGFCLWPASDYDYSVAQSPVKRDIVAEFIAACEAEGILPGVHYSVPDARNEGQVRFRGVVSASYFELIKRHTADLHRQHPGLQLQLFDGEHRLSQAQYQELRHTLKRENPQCLLLGSPTNEYSGQRPGDADLQHQAGTVVQGWLWSPDAALTPLVKLREAIAASSAKQQLYLLNVSPDRTGRIPDEQVAVLMILKQVDNQSQPQPSANPATSWVIPTLPKADANGWITLFDGERLYGCNPVHSFFASEKVFRRNGLLWVENAGCKFDWKARNATLRVRVKKVNGRNVTVRVGPYIGWFNGGKSFGIDRRVSDAANVSRTLTTGKSSSRLPDFFDMELMVVDGRITLMANGTTVATAQADPIKQNEVDLNVWTGGLNQFKKIEVKVLDK